MKFFDTLIKKLDNVSTNDLGKFVFTQSNIQKWIIETIQKRLYNLGESGDGTSLKTDMGNPYAFTTTEIKKKDGQPTDRVTLKDSGEFYKSFKIILHQSSVNIEADFWKDRDHIGDNFEYQFSNLREFENAITSLSDIEIEEMLNKQVLPEVINFLNKTLPNAS